MRNFESFNTIDIVEEKGKETKVSRPKFAIREHHIYKNLVVIGLANDASTQITVDADDLIQAIKNAQNAHH